jgi:hypothetical protein
VFLFCLSLLKLKERDMKSVALKDVAVGQVVGFGFNLSWFLVEVVGQLDNGKTQLKSLVNGGVFTAANTKEVDIV